jgi:hypothetical protein
MIGSVPRWLLLVGIVITASACDNVSWGGMEVGLQRPTADTLRVEADSSETVTPPLPSLSVGPLLYAGIREGTRARIFPVAELTEVGLRPLPDGPEGEEMSRQLLASRLRPGEELTLFHQGVRIGTLEVEEARPSDGPYCGVGSQAMGHLQLTPEAARVQHFLALEKTPGRRYPFAPFEELQSVYDQRVASLNLASEAIPVVGAPWPPSLLEIRQDLQVLRLPDLEGPAVMATFLYRDQLQVGPAPTGAYSLMVLGEPRGAEFNLAFSWYRPVNTEGKGAPRYFSRLDWDGDGDQEILLEVLGEDRRWFAAMNRGPDGWVLTYQDPCGAPGGGGG